MLANRPAFLIVAFQSLVVVISASQARASYLEGEVLTLQGAYPTKETIFYEYGPLTVGAGPELVVEDVSRIVDYVLDISDTSIVFEFPENNQFATGTFNGYIIQAEVGSIDPFREVKVDPSTTLAGFDNSRIMFEDYRIFLNVSGLVPNAGNIIRVDVSSVPEPGTVMLLLLGSIACMGRKKRFGSDCLLLEAVAPS